MSCQCKDCGEWIEHYVGHKCLPRVKVVGNDVIREIVERAHMAGQIDAGADPSYSNAQSFYAELFPD